VALALPVVYDTGALLAAEADDRRIRSLHQTCLEEGRAVVVPTPVLTQAWRDGSKQARLARLLRGCVIEPTPEGVARHAGVLLGRVGATDAVDAIVVACALRHGASIVTSDPRDLSVLVEAARSPRRPALIAL
jgi:predicted nucleic acid-binding protein